MVVKHITDPATLEAMAIREALSLQADRFTGFLGLAYIADVRPYVRFNERFSHISYRKQTFVR